MNSRRIGLLSIAFGFIVWPQVAPPAASDAGVRRAIERYLDAMRRRDREALVPLLRPNSARFSTGGTRLGTVAGNPRISPPDISSVSYFVRHVEFLRPNEIRDAADIWRAASR